MKKTIILFFVLLLNVANTFALDGSLQTEDEVDVSLSMSYNET